MQCEYAGCAKILRCDNASGYCKQHHQKSPHARQRRSAWAKRNAGRRGEARRIRMGAKTRYTMTKKCTVAGCGKSLRSDSTHLLCKQHYKIKWQRENYNPAVQAERRQKLLYGLSRGEKTALLTKQGGACAICGTDAPGARGWMTDHDHKTGKVRGVLCPGCNLGLGGFRDSSAALRRAADYVEGR